MSTHPPAVRDLDSAGLPRGARPASGLPARHATGRVRLGRAQVVARPRTLLVLAVAWCGVLALASLELGHGPRGVAVTELPGLLAHPGDSMQGRIAVGIRLPRVVTAVAVGALLGAAGAVTQAMARNVLASPEILGLTSGASTGAVLALVLGGDPLVVGLVACLGGLATAATVLLLSRRRGRVDTDALILSGIGVGALLQGCTAAMLVRAAPDTALVAQIWLVGTVNARSWAHAVVAVAAVAVGLAVLAAGVRHLDALDVGEEHARQLGVRVDRVRVVLGCVAVLMTSVAVAVAGPIGFVSLVSPQIARRALGVGGTSIATSAALGAVLLLAGDVLGLLAPVAATTPVGATTGLLGGIYLIVVLWRGARS